MEDACFLCLPLSHRRGLGRLSSMHGVEENTYEFLSIFVNCVIKNLFASVNFQNVQNLISSVKLTKVTFFLHCLKPCIVSSLSLVHSSLTRDGH